MSLTIKIRVNKYTNSTPVIYDVSNEVLINTIEIQKRADLSLENGTFKIFTSQIDYNIPPYSLCEINDGTTTEIYCISSECNSYLTKNKWTHDCKLYALESILEGYILGIKAFSLTSTNINSDYHIAFFITELLKQEDSRFTFNNSASYNELINAHNEYTFPDGTTYLEAFRQIANKNKLIVDLRLTGFNLTTMTFTISMQPYNNNSIEWLNSNGILSFKKLQNNDDYCKYLLSVGSDVVDRNNKTTFKDLTCRASNGVVIDADHAEIILPIRVEGITKFVVKGYVHMGTMRFTSPRWDRAYVEANLGGSSSTSEWTVAHTLYEWRTGSPLTGWQDIYDLWLKDLGLDNAYFAVYYNRDLQSPDYGKTWAYLCDDEAVDYNSAELYYYGTSMDMTDYVLTKEEFDALDVREQPKYVFYESGSNTIQNLYGKYKGDFWSNIIGTTVYGMFSHALNYNITKASGDYTIKYEFGIGGDTMPSQVNVMDYAFDVECVPITNPILIDQKNDTPTNEDSYKPMTRTYSMGDNNGLLVDFKALSQDIDKQNETLGKVEAVIEIDNSKIFYEYEEDDETYESNYDPTPNDRIVFLFKGKYYTYYVSSFVKRFTSTKTIFQLNLTKTPYKIADAIGVDYQFNPTWLPYENVVERPLFFEITENNFSGLIQLNTLLVQIQLSDTNILLRPAIMKADGYWILYCECQNNVVVGMSTHYEDVTKKSIVNVKCGDANASSTYISINIRYKNSALSNEHSFLLPQYPNDLNLTGNIAVIANKKIYKDSREKLTFTIKVNDNNIS